MCFTRKVGCYQVNKSLENNEILIVRQAIRAYLVLLGRN